MLKLNKKQQKFCDIYAKYGGNYSLVCENMHIGGRMYAKYMAMPEVKEYIDCSMQRCREGIIASLPHIQKSLLEMYNSNETDNRIKLEIAKQFLDRAGVLADRNTNINVNINTQLSLRARQLMIERQNAIETTANAVTERDTIALPCQNAVTERDTDFT